MIVPELQNALYNCSRALEAELMRPENDKTELLKIQHLHWSIKQLIGKDFGVPT